MSALDHLVGWREAGVFTDVEVESVGWLQQGLRVADPPEVQLALALALRAPRLGHVATPLSAAELAAAADPGDEALWASLPNDVEGWGHMVCASPLVQCEFHEGPQRPFVWSGGLLYAHRYWKYERDIGEYLSRQMRIIRPLGDLSFLRIGLAAHFPGGTAMNRQALAVALAPTRAVLALSGGPGTGKTYTVRALLALLWAQTPGTRVALAAPTGKAAARVVESLRKDLDRFLSVAAATLPADRPVEELRAFLESMEAVTVHRLLRWRPENPTRYFFGADQPLSYDWVVVDETSMLDLPMMAHLTEALRPETSIVFLGDRLQLSSVQAGSVFADLCEAVDGEGVRVALAQAAHLDALGFPRAEMALEDDPIWGSVVQLTESRRFHANSGIGQVAAAVTRGESALPLFAQRADLQWLDAHSATLHPDSWVRIQARYRAYLRVLLRGRADHQDTAGFVAEALTALDHFRVLCAHRSGTRGVEIINQKIEAWFSRMSRGALGGEMGGSPIMLLKNDHDLGLFNGDIGLILMGDSVLESLFITENGLTRVPLQRTPAYEPAWAMTVHKSQGSEYDEVLLVLPETPSPILTRELIYTAITRAKTRLSVDGSPARWEEAVARVTRRHSGLRARINANPARTGRS